MEAHTPDHPILTPRDFLLHIFTIMVGLLMALGFESSVEWVHHRHQLSEARQMLAGEKNFNIVVYHQDSKSFAEADQEIRLYLKALRQAIDTNTTPAEPYTIDPVSANLQTAVWKTADHSGALLLMPTDELSNNDELYRSIDQLNDQFEKTYLAIDHARAIFFADPDPHHLTHEQQVALYTDLTDVLSNLYEVKMIEIYIERHNPEFR